MCTMKPTEDFVRYQINYKMLFIYAIDMTLWYTITSEFYVFIESRVT